MRSPLGFSVLSIILIFLIFIHTRGTVINDDGYILNSASRIIHGQIPYKDFDFVYTPISIFLNSLGFTIFGESILSSRIIAILISLAAVICMMSAFQQLKLRVSYTLLLILIYLLFSSSIINFANPLIYAVHFYTISLSLLIIYTLTKNNIFMYMSGFIASLSFLSKQNIGAAFFLSLLFFVIHNRKKINQSIGMKLLISLVFPFFVWTVYLLVTHSAGSFIHNIQYYTVQKFILEGILNSPYFHFEGNLIYALGKTIFYYSPLLISAGTFFILGNNTKQLLFVPVATLLIFLAGFRPETDINHVAPLIAVSSLSGALTLKYGSHTQKLFVYFIIIGFTCVGFYTAFVKGYYRWQPPLIHPYAYSNHPKVRIFVDEEFTNDIKTLDTISSLTNHQPIFIYHYSPLYYFISDLKNPTRYDYVSSSSLSITQEQDIINTLEMKKIMYIAIHPQTSYSPLLSKYIKGNYSHMSEQGILTLLKRKNSTISH